MSSTQLALCTCQPVLDSLGALDPLQVVLDDAEEAVDGLGDLVFVEEANNLVLLEQLEVRDDFRLSLIASFSQFSAKFLKGRTSQVTVPISAPHSQTEVVLVLLLGKERRERRALE